MLASLIERIFGVRMGRPPAVDQLVVRELKRAVYKTPPMPDVKPPKKEQTRKLELKSFAVAAQEGWRPDLQQELDIRKIPSVDVVSVTFERFASSCCTRVYYLEEEFHDERQLG